VVSSEKPLKNFEVLGALESTGRARGAWGVTNTAVAGRQRLGNMRVPVSDKLGWPEPRNLGITSPDLAPVYSA
jgi:hypothetical protein